MITQLKIERFKSIKHLDLPCRRINVFIGEPNTGKSNILEALGFLSWCEAPRDILKHYVRFETISNLFYDNLVADSPITISTEGSPAIRISVSEGGFFQVWDASGDKRHLIAELDAAGMARKANETNPGSKNKTAETTNNAATTATNNNIHDASRLPHILFYRFSEFVQGVHLPQPIYQLLPPRGWNIFDVVYSSLDRRKWATELFESSGLRLAFRPDKKVMELVKHQDGILTIFPFTLVSDTLVRMLFYHMAMSASNDSTLVFEEPEAHSFPYYTKHLGERIGLDSTNQYFIATHNPYLLLAILEKAPAQEVSIVGVRYRDYQTVATPLSDAQLARLLEADPFLGLESVLEEP